jgi:hypothetical protein
MNIYFRLFLLKIHSKSNIIKVYTSVVYELFEISTLYITRVVDIILLCDNNRGQNYPFQNKLQHLSSSCYAVETFS